MKLTRQEDVGAWCRDRRRHLRMSQSELAARMHVSVNTILSLEHGGNVSIGKLMRAMRILGLELCGGEIRDR